MAKYYFTFGYDAGGGWTEVTADSYYKASEVFKLYHPPFEGDFLPCAGMYSEKEFKKTKMFRDGNFGKREVEYIVLSRFDFKKETEHGTDT